MNPPTIRLWLFTAQAQPKILPSQLRSITHCAEHIYVFQGLGRNARHLVSNLYSTAFSQPQETDFLAASTA